MGYVILGIGVWSAVAGQQYDAESWKLGMNGAMFQMIAHGISSPGMFFMVGVVYDRVHHRNLDQFGGLFARMPAYSGLALVIPVAAIELGVRQIGPITPGIVLGILYLGIISTAAAMWLWNRAFALVEASTASLFFFAQPLVGALLSVLLLGQAMTLNLWIGSFLIVLGVALATLAARSVSIRTISLEGER